MLGVVHRAPLDQTAAAGHGRSPHDPRRPDVAEHAALVADGGHQPRLVDQFVELGPVLVGYLPAHVGDLLLDLDVGGGDAPPRDRRTDGAQQSVGHLERVPPADVEAVEQAVAREVEVGAQRPAGVGVEVAQLVEHLARVAVGLEEVTRRGILAHGHDQALELGRPAAGDRSGAAQHAQQAVGRQPGPVADVGQQVADADHRRAGEAHVLIDHLHVPVPAPAQVLDQLGVGESVGVDRLQLAVRLDRLRLADLVPLAQLLPPDLLLEDLLGALQPGRHLVGRDR